MHGPCGPPRWSSEREAWLLTRFGDVVAGLREGHLSAAGRHGDTPLDALDESAHREARRAVHAALPGEAVAAWRAQIEPLAARLVGALPADREVDLIGELAEPVALTLAVAVTGSEAGEARRLSALAREVFSAAAEPDDDALRLAAERATLTLAGAVRQPIDVQTFVALAHTLPCWLGAAWQALLDHRAELARLLAEPARIPDAVEELLRVAGPAQAQFRRAAADVSLGGVRIGAGDRVILMLAAANRDPERWPDPDRLDLSRDATGHVAFGAGAHACPGATVIRMAAAVLTAAVAPRLAATTSVRSEGRGGFAIRGLASLWVDGRRSRRE